LAFSRAPHPATWPTALRKRLPQYKAKQTVMEFSI